MRYRLAGQQCLDFDEDGVVRLLSVLSGDLLARASDAADRIMAQETGSLGQDDYFKRLGLWQKHEAFRAICMDSCVPEIGARLLRPGTANLLYDQLFVKEPGSDIPTPWHNDLPYWPHRGTQVLTVWLALDPIELANGVLEFFRGSHKWAGRHRPFYTTADGRISDFFYADDDDYDDLPDFEMERRHHEILSWDMEPGDALVFHALTVHGAPGNRRADMARRGYAVRLTGADVHYREGAVWNVDLINAFLRDGDPLDSEQFPVVYEVPASPEHHDHTSDR
jgi:ectoine hydroxylase-related dioxygenase (phytanoyl-CoA dioxygenase family)